MKKNLSSSAKEEALGKEFGSNCCRLAFLSAIIHTAGSLLIEGKGRLGVLIKSSNLLLKKRLETSLKGLYELTLISEGRELRIKGENMINALTDCRVLKQGEELGIVLGIDPELIKNECCAAAYACGSFVGCGSISVGGAGYHLEFAFEGGHMAEDLISLLMRAGIEAKQTRRKEKYIVYLKDSEAISDCLAFCGAGRAALNMNVIFVDRQVRQQSNRQLNCDMANLERTVNVGVQQAASFLEIIEDLTDDKLIKTAETRIANPEASYEQLAKILEITKSGVKHRLKKLGEIATEKRETKE